MADNIIEVLVSIDKRVTILEDNHNNEIKVLKKLIRHADAALQMLGDDYTDSALCKDLNKHISKKKTKTMSIEDNLKKEIKDLKDMILKTIKLKCNEAELVTIGDLESEIKELKDFVNYLSDKIEDAAQQNSNYVIETQDIERIKKLKQ